MNIQLNGEARTVAASTLDALLTECGYEGLVVATALNGSFVPAALRADTEISQGDAVEVLAPMQGG